VRIARVDPPDRPLPGLRVVGAYGDAVAGARLSKERVFLHIGLSVDQPAIGACAFEIRPAAVALDAVMHAPLSELEVEVVRSRDAQPGVSNGRNNRAAANARSCQFCVLYLKPRLEFTVSMVEFSDSHRR
jgi:hypothetical protein